MKYKVFRNTKYDFAGEAYAKVYPNLHKYPATMIPQIGIEVLKELNINNGILLDPYCGSGSTFASAIEVGINEMWGFDINPLAILISYGKFTKLNPELLETYMSKLQNLLYSKLELNSSLLEKAIPKVSNLDYWFSPCVIKKLATLKIELENIPDENIRRFFTIPFSETVRECSFTRNSEFKLYRIDKNDLDSFRPDVYGTFFSKLKSNILIYKSFYYPKLKYTNKINLNNKAFEPINSHYDVVLTSPPYGDSRTTVAYGQFSTLSNEWLGHSIARKIDNLLMGGKKNIGIYSKGIIGHFISEINRIEKKRALEVSSFYDDLEMSIRQVAKSVKLGGKVIYIVGNRTVKNIQLPTDQFVAESFENYGFKHLCTYERLISSKVMPSQNSPTNKTGFKVNTMLFEYIVICEKINNS
jgi:hypothetical protein